MPFVESSVVYSIQINRLRSVVALGVVVNIASQLRSSEADMPENTTCSISTCKKTVYMNGWCASHYRRNHIHGTPTPCVDAKKCPSCKQTKPVGEFYHNAARDDGLSPECVVCHRKRGRARNLAKRLEVIRFLGGQCSSASCAVPGGMADPRALQIDHVNGGGSKKRRNKEENYHSQYKAILAGKEGYQLLCANCNWIKKSECGEFKSDTPRKIIPTKRLLGPGRGWHPNSRNVLLAWHSRATSADYGTRNTKAWKTRKGKAR